MYLRIGENAGQCSNMLRFVLNMEVCMNSIEKTVNCRKAVKLTA